MCVKSTTEGVKVSPLGLLGPPSVSGGESGPPQCLRGRGERRPPHCLRGRGERRPPQCLRGGEERVVHPSVSGGERREAAHPSVSGGLRGVGMRPFSGGLIGVLRRDGPPAPRPRFSFLRLVPSPQSPPSGTASGRPPLIRPKAVSRCGQPVLPEH